VRPHFPAFEGLRALAAVMVVVHHAAATAGRTRAGVLATPAAVMDSGVAVFFVISGFLIYRPFAAAHLAGEAPLRFRSFWWRRALRIVPAYWLALTFFWAIGSFRLGPEWWRYYVFLQIYSKSTVLGGVLQAWSLCTEITFYLFIPFWAAAIGRLTRRGRAPVAELVGCGLLYAAAFVARAVISSQYPGRRGLAFDWLPTNLDLFAVGMTVAVASAWAARDVGVRRALDRLVAWPGLLWAAAIGLFAWYAYRVGPADFATGYQGWFWQQRQLVLGILTLLLLLPVVFGDQRRGLGRRLLTSAPVAWVGSVSYGLYLWHFDWIKRVSSRSDGLGRPLWRGWAGTPQFDTNVFVLLAVGLGVGLLFAALSWELVERPLQRLKRLL
jgi:peptidoglycan/LPS O-acetylase OafA/YrhL